MSARSYLTPRYGTRKSRKLIYAVLVAKRKLMHYFESNHVMVVTSATLNEIIQICDASGQMPKWATKHMGHHITYVPTTAIKLQVLTDFVIEWTVY